MSRTISDKKVLTILLGIILGLSMVLAIGSQNVYAGDESEDYYGASTTIDNVRYCIDNRSPGNAMVYIGFEDDIQGTVNIRDSVIIEGKRYSVTWIDEYAFTGCTGMTGVIIPSSITKIGEAAFASTGFREVTIPSSVKQIDKYAIGYTRTYNEETDEDVFTKVPGFTIKAAKGSAGFNYAAQNGFNAYDPSVAAVTLGSSVVNAATINKAIAAAGGTAANVNKVVLGKNVKKIAKGTFKQFRSVKTIEVKTKKLKKKSVKGSLKGSSVTTIKVKVGGKKANKKIVKKYKKIFTKKNAGKKVKVK